MCDILLLSAPPVVRAPDRYRSPSPCVDCNCLAVPFDTQFSVAFPSGVRRASSLTPSLDIRLGPPPAPLQPATDREGGAAVGDGLIRYMT